MTARDMTVGQLRELLADHPDHQLVAVGIQQESIEGTPVLVVGILLGAQLIQSSGLAFPDRAVVGVGTTPVLVLGEVT